MTKNASTRIFYTLLGNTLATSVVNNTIWFAITYFVYLQTHSVFATAIIAGLFLVLTAASGFWFGSIVDHNKKKVAMLLSSAGSLTLYAISFAIYLIVGADAFKDPASVILWIFVGLLMIGVVAGNIRTITLPTLVTLLVPEDKRDKANGLVGATTGLSFLATSVISGLLVGLSGMFDVLVLAIVVTIAAITHVLFVRIPEKEVVHNANKPKNIDIRGTIKVIFGVPGLFALILFTTLNNFLGGVYMALLDPYGLSLVSVQTWGLLWGFLSSGFIIGGLVVAKKGLGKNPLRVLMLTNVVLWSVASVFTIQASIIILAVGLFVYMCLIPVAEAAEQTILQKVVPLERQGRVFGFAQSIEQAAAPLTAFLVGPLAQFVFIPFMTTGAGAKWIGGWYGTGPARGIALVFTVTGIIGLGVTLIAMASKYYRMLSSRLKNTPTKGQAPQIEELSKLA